MRAMDSADAEEFRRLRQMDGKPKYVLVTPARNEQEFIGNLLASIVRQTILPEMHVVVSDGSNDGTDAIVTQYAKRYSFISLLRIPNSGKRCFGSKVSALKSGFDAVKVHRADYLGCLDADITLGHDYYERVIARMKANPQMGLASGICIEKTENGLRRIMSNSNHVPGPVQLFRRESYEAIGGYHPVSVMGEDSLAEIRVRMNGWETKSFSDIVAYHHRRIGSATAGALRTCFRFGQTDYHLGKHPLFILLKAVRRVFAPPYLVGSVAQMTGYFGLWCLRSSRDATSDIVDFVQREEFAKLRAMFLRGKIPV